MSVQTPKNYDKKSTYTSPIGLLKNYSTMNAPNTGNTYEEQFYRIKAMRLESEIEQLREENGMLRAKLTDSSAANQILKERIVTLQGSYERSYTQRTVPSFITDSGYPSGHNSGRQSPTMQTKYFSVSIPEKSQRSAYNTEIERLLKENRVLKNEHELEMSKLRDENKKLNRKLIELETKKTVETEPEIEEKSYRQKMDDRCLKLQRVNNQLRKENEEFQRLMRKLEEKSKGLEDSNKALRRENEELKVLGASKTRNQSALQEFQARAETRQKEYNEEKEKLLAEINDLKSKSQPTPKSPIKPQQPSTQPQNEPLPAPNPKLQKQIQQLKRKIGYQEESLAQKDAEIKNMLVKLKPLLQKDKASRNAGTEIIGDPKRASLSILQVFLSKYKINTF